jgi:release factor glutamine methyltransferase
MPRPGSLARPVLTEIVTLLRAAGCVFAEDEAQLLLSEASGPAKLTEWISRRVSGEPLEYIVGWAGFCGLRIAVDPGVFVPRLRTELVVSEAVTLLRQNRTAGAEPGIVVDLCCGSGAVGVAVASQMRVKELHAADIDSAAVECARRNLAAVGGEVHQGDLYAGLPSRLRGRVKLIVVNAPYVPTDVLPTMPPEARIYEPRISLDGGPDGLNLHRRIIGEAPEWLYPGGHLVIETSERQAAGTAGIMAAAGLAGRTVHSEELDGTVVVGTLRLQE